LHGHFRCASWIQGLFRCRSLDLRSREPPWRAEP
jgi:hypothetical protein